MLLNLTNPPACVISHHVGGIRNFRLYSTQESVWHLLHDARVTNLLHRFKCTYLYNILQQEHQQRLQQKRKSPMTPKVAVNAVLKHCQHFYSDQYHAHDEHNGLCGVSETGVCSIKNNEYQAAATATAPGGSTEGSLSLCRRGCISVHLQQLSERKKRNSGDMTP